MLHVEKLINAINSQDGHVVSMILIVFDYFDNITVQNVERLNGEPRADYSQ